MGAVNTSLRSGRGNKRSNGVLRSPAVFSQIDAHAIKAGEELRRKRIFSVKAITEAITVGAKDDKQKLRAIWIWLCHNIEYDVRYMGKTTTTEQIIKTRRGVCCDYARLCKQMCSEVGIECREVSGHSKGASYRPDEPTQSNHAWNAVRLQGNWYLLDSCWGAGTVNKKVFNKCYNEFYFLTDPDMFISDHFPDEVEWQLLKKPLSLEEFRKRVHKTSRFFQLGLTLHHPTHSLLTPLKHTRQEKMGAVNTSLRSGRGNKRSNGVLRSPAVFSQIDAHAIKAGEELRRKRIFSVKAITEAITVGAKDDKQKLRAIWIWLCHNIEYDVRYMGKTTTTEQIIKTRRGVCCDYARLCKQMCSEVGIECREVSGHSKGASYRPDEPTQSNHAWNAVRLQGNWYLLDSCWGAGTVNKKVFNKCYNEFYFLTDPDMFISDHFPDEVEWQLLKKPLSLEEFRKRVHKTSRFFQLGLTLHHPTHSLLVTENGEATVSMTFPEPLEFSYKISQRSGNKQRELSTSAAFLTVTTTHMKLRLRPPTQGTFNVIVFAQTANTSDKLHKVCNFLLECPKPSPLDSFPENPSMSWGLNQSAKNMGLKPCQYQAEIMLESATFEMVLQTSRPLMMLCKLFHKDLDEALAKRCVATQSEPDQLSCHVLCLYVGYYQLKVCVKDCDSTGNSYCPVGTFLLHCTSSATININRLFPPGLSSDCGPGNDTLKAGLADFSHTRAIINTQQGKCSITFRNQHSLKLKADLSGQERQQPKHPLSRYVLLSSDEKDVTISVALPRAGVYRLRLFGGPATSTSLSRICDYVLRSDWSGAWPPFPESYSTWNAGCVLFEPRTGHLEPKSKVHFCVKVPRAIKVTVIGQDHTELHLNQKSQKWEGEVHTSTVPKLKLAASFPGGAPGKLDILLCFDVLRTPHGMR